MWEKSFFHGLEGLEGLLLLLEVEFTVSMLFLLPAVLQLLILC